MRHPTPPPPPFPLLQEQTPRLSAATNYKPGIVFIKFCLLEFTYF